MKKIKIAIIFAILSQALFSQHITSETQVIRVGTNLKISTKGGYNYSDSGDTSIYVNWVTKFESGNEFGLFFEYEALNPDYYSGGLIWNKNINIIHKEWIETLVGVEAIWIQRSTYRNENIKIKGEDYFTGGVAASLNFNITNQFQAGSKARLFYRQDIAKMWGITDFKELLNDGFGVYVYVGFKFN